jgi:lipopolysaccharide export system protein LptA
MRRCINPLLKSLAVIFFAAACVHAQVPQEAKSIRGFRKVFYRTTAQAKIPEAVCTGAEANPLTGSQIQVKDFQLETLRDGQTTQFTAKSPECMIDVKEEYASSPGALQGFTANTNFYIQGVGFLCTKSNSLLVISNQVETRIEKSAMKGSLPLGAHSNAGGEIVKIFSEHFRLLYQSNQATYLGHVRVVDPRMTLTCEILNAYFNANGSIKSIIAERNVVLTQTNGSTATADDGVYTIVGTNETVALSGHAHWNDGEHDATARSFFYDNRTDDLKANDGVKVHYANNSHRAPRGTNDFSDLFANVATISNATKKHSTAQNVLADGDVLMTNHFDHSYVRSYRAAYTATNGIVELTGSPLFKSERGEISGYILTIDRSNNVFHSRGNTRAVLINPENSAHTKRPVEQKVFVNSTDMDYTTNEVTFTGDVDGHLESDGARVANLGAQELVLHLGASNQLVSAVAHDRVRVEKIDTKRGNGTLSCDTLTVNRNAATGLLRDIAAQGNCRFDQTSVGPKIVSRTLTAPDFFAEFSPTTNKVERFVADGGIVATQAAATTTNKISGTKMVYVAQPIEKIEVTGHPKAVTDRAVVSNADLFTWLVKTGTFRATGRYNITPTPRSNSLPSR